MVRSLTHFVLCVSLLLVTSCAPVAATSVPAETRGQSVTATATPKGAVQTQTVVPTTQAARTAITTAAAKLPPGSSDKEALTAREAFAVADVAARKANAGYKLYKVGGCRSSATSLTFERDSHLVVGACVQWVFEYVRPVQEGSLKGYHDLLLWVAPNGVMNTKEELRASAAYKSPKGTTSDWQIDSVRAIEIAENGGGREYREKNPRWDTSRFESDKNATMIATLEFSPYFDTSGGKGRDIGGSSNVVWVVKYPPLDKLVVVIDGRSGEVLLKVDESKKP